ncbi:MAG: response regulator [Cyanobacteria bacterium P01_G01_bin.54]
MHNNFFRVEYNPVTGPIQKNQSARMIESPTALPVTQSDTVLAVDDQFDNLTVLFYFLETAGYQVVLAENGEAALKQAKEHQPNLILLDVMMPGLDGFETCRRLKAAAETSMIPVIFMTALTDTKDKVKGFNMGAVDYITKPLQKDEVLSRVKVHLELYHLQQTLEQRVAVRTAELHHALKHLKDTQVQLVHTEKMSSLGQLVAGVAHEINNPITFIHGNLQPAQIYIEDLLYLVQLFCSAMPEPTAAIAEHMEAMDFEFVQQDLPKVVQSMNQGTERIKDLVLSLRNFSRLDEMKTEAVNLHDGLESTLLILHHRLKSQVNSIEIIKDYGELPPVHCYPSQLNQVFMNLIGNSLDALEELSQEAPGHNSEALRIQIKTQCLGGDRIQIIISDNGPGIPEAVKANIFDAFYTTKPMGKGTGLGLSISHQIVVEKHGGRLYCDSTVGQGTQFVIELPICQDIDQS